MKWPWEKRAEAAEKVAAETEQAYEMVEDQWDHARQLAARAGAQREMNGWTSKVLEIFGG